MLTNIHTFFTLWVFILVIFHIRLHKHINLIYLTLLVMIGGLYISYIHPRQYTFYLFDEKYEMKGWDKLILIDLFFHILIFVFIWQKYRSYYLNVKYDYPFLNALAILLIYSSLISSYDTYRLHKYELFLVMLVATLLYLILF